MACELKPSCDFLFRFCQCAFPEDTIYIEVTVRMVKGIHTYRTDHTTKSGTCSPWSRQMKPFPLCRKQIEAFKEEKRNKNSSFTPRTVKFTKKAIPSKRSRDRSLRRSKSMSRKLDMGHFAPPKAKRPALLWAPLPASETTTTTTMAINTQVATSSPPMTTYCKTCKKWEHPAHSLFSQPHSLYPQESVWSDKDWNGDRQREREERKKKEQQQKEEAEKNKREEVPKDSFPMSPIYDPTCKEDA